MKRDMSKFRLAGLAMFLATAPSLAHHAFSAEFDANKPLTLTGVVTKVEWQNPHTWFYIDVTDDSGNVASWGLELASPNLLMRAGWSRSSMKIGDAVTVEAFHAKNGENIANAKTVTLNATGRRLFAGPSGGSTP